MEEYIRTYYLVNPVDAGCKKSDINVLRAGIRYVKGKGYVFFTEPLNIRNGFVTYFGCLQANDPLRRCQIEKVMLSAARRSSRKLAEAKAMFQNYIDANALCIDKYLDVDWGVFKE